MAQLTVELDESVPQRTKAIVGSIPGIIVKPNRPRNRLIVNGKSMPVAVLPGRPAPLAQATAPMFAALAEPNQVTFVVADRLAQHVRRELEKAGLAYADGTGAAHIDVPGLYFHVEGRPSRSQEQAPAPKGIGVVGVRAISNAARGT